MSMQSHAANARDAAEDRAWDDLVERALQGHDDAKHELLTRVGPSMLMVIRKVMGARYIDVDDILQDAMLGLLKALPGFRGEASVSHFACRVALLTAMAARRRVFVRQDLTDADQCPDDLGDRGERSPFLLTLRQRRMEALLGLLIAMPSKLADVLASHFVLGHSVDEIARAMGVPVNTVWSRLRLGKESLRRSIESSERLSDLMEMAE